MLRTFTMLMRTLGTLANRRMAVGENVLPLPADGWRTGTYFVRLQTKTEVVTVPLTLLK